MATYLAPGVYVEEIPSAQQPIAGVGTSTAAFVGVVPDEIQFPVPNEDYDPDVAAAAARTADTTARDQEIARLQGQNRELETQRTQAQDAIPPIDEELGQDPAARRRTTLETRKAELEQQIQQLTTNIEANNQEMERLRTAAAAPAAEPSRPYNLQTFQVTAEPYAPKLCTNFSEYTRRFGTYSADDPAQAPGVPLHPEHRALTHAVNGFFKNGGTRCYVVRVPSTNTADIERALSAIESIDAVAIVAAPGLDGQVIWGALVAHCEKCEDRFAVLDCPADVETGGELNVNLLNYDTPDNLLPQRNKNAAYYFPYIQVIDPAKQMQDQDPLRRIPLKHRGKVYVAPSGHIAGIYARTDEERGVHKAPANTAIIGALSVKYYIGRPRHGLLNPQGVNCIRNLNGNITVWGARTIGGDKNGEWKYINVRRLFLFLRESIDEGTQWAVFEPNDNALWGKIRRNLTAFLTNVWRAGALFGLTPEQAFYVKCDEETNPPEVRDLGQVVTEIGVAIVRPAEFVIFRITQTSEPNVT